MEVVTRPDTAGDLDRRVETALGDCPLFRALKPEQLRQLAEGRGARRLRAQRDHRHARASPPTPSSSSSTAMAAVTADRGDGEVQLGQIPLPEQPGRGQPAAARAAHGHA